jgi:hypothetical protein
MIKMATILIATSVLASNLVTQREPMHDVRLKKIDQIEVQSDDDRIGTFTVKMHSFQDYTGVQQSPDHIQTRRARKTGFVISVIQIDAKEERVESRMIWARPYVLIHIPGDPLGDSPELDWRPIEYDLGALWWDEASDSLWIAVAITTKHTSMIHVHELPMKRDLDTGMFIPVGEERVSQYLQQISHPRGEPDRVVNFAIHSQDNDGIVLKVNRADENAEPVYIPITRSDPRSQMYRGINVAELANAIQEHVMEE